jgi:hypothetical protein
MSEALKNFAGLDLKEYLFLLGLRLPLQIILEDSNSIGQVTVVAEGESTQDSPEYWLPEVLETHFYQCFNQTRLC